MQIKGFLRRLAPTRVIARTEGVDIVTFKYLPHLIVTMIAFVVLYWLMGGELP